MSVGFFSGPLLAGLVTDIWNIDAAFWLAGAMAALGAVAVLLMTKSRVD
jgi:predicted MFS family arabinose efflux permease